MGHRDFNLAVALVWAALLCGGCASNPASARVQRYFGLEDVGSEEAIRDGLEARFPLGTTETEIVEFMAASEVGKDGLSSVKRMAPTENPWGQEGGILCDINLDPNTPGLVKEEYFIVFLLDLRGRLSGIKVEKSLKGL